MSSLELAGSTANARQRGQAVIQIDRHRAPTVAPAANSLQERSPHSASLLHHGLRWAELPLELRFGIGVTCWRRLRQWQERGVGAAVHQVVLNWLGDLVAIDWSRASLDSISVRAKRGGEHTGPNPTDRGKAGSKYHLLVDRRGVPGRSSARAIRFSNVCACALSAARIAP